LASRNSWSFGWAALVSTCIQASIAPWEALDSIQTDPLPRVARLAAQAPVDALGEVVDRVLGVRDRERDVDRPAGRAASGQQGAPGGPCDQQRTLALLASSRHVRSAARTVTESRATRVAWVPRSFVAASARVSPETSTPPALTPSAIRSTAVDGCTKAKTRAIVMIAASRTAATLQRTLIRRSLYALLVCTAPARSASRRGLSLLLVLVHLRYRSMLTVAGEPWRRLSDHRSDGDLGEAFAAAFGDHDWRYESVLQLAARMHPGELALAIDHLDALLGTRTDDLGDVREAHAEVFEALLTWPGRTCGPSGAARSMCCSTTSVSRPSSWLRRGDFA